MCGVVCHRVTRNNCKRKDRVKNQFSPADTDMDERLGYRIGHNSQECVVWKRVI